MMSNLLAFPMPMYNNDYMKLMKAKIKGYGRFYDEVKLDLDGKLICLVGTNESGKSTLLSSLLEVYSGIPIAREKVNKRVYDGDDLTIVHTYLVENEDIESLKGMRGFKNIPRWLDLVKNKDGSVKGILYPQLEIDRSSGSRIVTLIRSLSSSKSIPAYVKSANLDGKWLSDEELAATIGMLEASTGGKLGQASMENKLSLLSFIERLNSIKGLVRDDNDLKMIEELSLYSAYIENLATAQKTRNSIATLLAKRIPNILYFDNNSREVKEYYSMDKISDPGFMSNLFQAVDIDIHQISLNEDGFMGEDARLLLKRATSRFNTLINQYWNQSDVQLDLIVEGGKIYIYASYNDGEDYASIQDRSEGFKSFIALLAFVKSNAMSLNPPVVLIDELENHLHYDAQANMISFLVEQSLARKIVYTTHSPGCLPNDLTKVRGVYKTTHSSKINNRIWSSETPGMKNLFWALGAKEYAFSSSRNAVICEGESDFLIYPAIMSSFDEKWRNFQFIPGYAVVKDPLYLNKDAVNVGYIFDGDADGHRYSRRLLEIGVKEGLIANLPDGLVLEDILKPKLYVEAVKEELKRSHGDLEIDLADLPNVNRPAYIEKKCKELKISSPSKRAVADRLLEISGQEALWDNIYEQNIRQISKSLMENLSSLQL